jgi:predicted amidohydrolase
VVAQVGGRSAQEKGEWAECMDPSPRAVEGFALARFDLAAARQQRLGWGLFRDRRPELYGAIASLDGAQRHAAAAK